MSEMLTPQSILFPDADEVCRRTDDNILSMRKMRTSVEGKLVMLLLLMSCCCNSAGAGDNLSIVVFMCVWKREQLTKFVLAHYDSLKGPLARGGIELDIFITGSEDASTAEMAASVGAGYAVHANSPLGAKHGRGLRSLREYYEGNVRDAVMVVGSDDILNEAYFWKVKELMGSKVKKKHVVGIQDIYFYELKSGRMVYSKGYSVGGGFSGTMGCGRVFSWAVLDTLKWQLWDEKLERGLDQSASRQVIREIAMIEAVSGVIDGRESGAMAVDVKSETNVWKFERVVDALQGSKVVEGRRAMGAGFGEEMVEKLAVLQWAMNNND